MASTIRWYGHVLRRENGHVLRRALDLEVEAQRKKGKQVKVGLRMEDALC